MSVILFMNIFWMKSFVLNEYIVRSSFSENKIAVLDLLISRSNCNEPIIKYIFLYTVKKFKNVIIGR